MADHVVVAGRPARRCRNRGAAGDVAELLDRFAQLRRKRGRGWVKSSDSSSSRRLVSTDSGLIECCGRKYRKPCRPIRPRSRHHVDDGEAKTDRIDGEALVRALLAYKRGEPRVCAIVKAPTPEEEDRRRVLSRAQGADPASGSGTSIAVKGLLFSTGDI